MGATASGAQTLPAPGTTYPGPGGVSIQPVGGQMTSFGGGSGKGGTPSFTQAPTGGAYNPFEMANTQLQQGWQGTWDAMNYKPMMIDTNNGILGSLLSGAGGGGGGGGGVAAEGVGYNAAQLKDADIGGYMSPYIRNVVDAATRDLERSYQQNLNDVGARAQAAGAFGGSRHGLVEAETGRNYLDTVGRTTADLYNQGYLTAQQAALSDVGALNDSRAFGANAKNAASITNAQTAAQMNAAASSAGASMFNSRLNAALQAAMANQDAGLQQNQNLMYGSNQLGSLANTGFNMGQTVNQNLANDGAQQQALMQQIINGARNQWDGYTNAPRGALDYLTSAISGAPNIGTTTQGSDPGAMDYATTAMNSYLAYLAVTSDARLKENIEPIGEAGGHNVYRWRWTDAAKRLGHAITEPVGVIAQEVLASRPDAVSVSNDGFLQVNYGALFPRGV